MQALEISGNSERPLTVQVLRFSDGAVIDADHNPVAGAARITDVADASSAPDSAENRLNPSVSNIGNGSVPYLVPSSDALPAAIEHNVRLIEDEPPQKPARRRSERGRPV
jgi:hypothetical protein